MEAHPHVERFAEDFAAAVGEDLCVAGPGLPAGGEGGLVQRGGDDAVRGAGEADVRGVPEPVGGGLPGGAADLAGFDPAGGAASRVTAEDESGVFATGPERGGEVRDLLHPQGEHPQAGGAAEQVGVADHRRPADGVQGGVGEGGGE